jgi:16S rRNA (cytosine967-C5)-methyltransferase
MSSSRQCAFIALKEIYKGAYADVALNRVLQKFSLSDRDMAGVPRSANRRLLTELVYGCTRRQRTLDGIIDQLAKKKSQQQPPDLRTILHIGLYQLIYQQRIPPSAAVNTTVELTKENKISGLSGFVNGLLREYIRLIPSSPSPPFPLPICSSPGIVYSFPDWIINVWLEEFGLVDTEKLCEWMNQTPSIDLRINSLRTSLEEVETALNSYGVETTRLPMLPEALRLTSSPGNIENLPGFQEGWWTIQDSSAQLVSYLLDPQPDEIIIDACAAPGGKTTHIAELMKDRGKILGCDRTSSRLKKVKENAQRLQLKSIEFYTGDSRNFTQFHSQADRVLLDAPCSGLGTLNRHADARWRQTPESVEELSILQRELLCKTSEFVKVGGVLVYSTCTLHPQENERIIESFLKENSHWEIETPSSDSPLALLTTPEGWIKVLPHQQNMDGFFMVRLRKNKEIATQ